MSTGKIWIATLNKFLELCSLAIEEDRILSVIEIALNIECSKSNAYNYSRALKKLLSLINS
jgi:hypothetical protein